jgi:hypothetical protein
MAKDLPDCDRLSHGPDPYESKLSCLQKLRTVSAEVINSTASDAMVIQNQLRPIPRIV